MNEFWLWFWRPIAETLGAILLLIILGIGFMAIIAYSDWKYKRNKQKQKQSNGH